jgi:hypothetical protein
LVAIERKKSAGLGNVFDNVLRLVKAGSLAGNDKASGSIWPGSDTVANYGGAGDTWGLTLTGADVKASNFGVGFSVRATGGTATAAVDDLPVTIYWEDPSSLSEDGFAVPRDFVDDAFAGADSGTHL